MCFQICISKNIWKLENYVLILHSESREISHSKELRMDGLKKYRNTFRTYFMNKLGGRPVKDIGAAEDYLIQ